VSRRRRRAIPASRPLVESVDGLFEIAIVLIERTVKRAEKGTRRRMIRSAHG
jgi:hypothetical protein